MYSSGVKRVKTVEKTLPHYFTTEIKLFLCTPRRLMGEWKYSFIHSQPWHQMGGEWSAAQHGSSTTTDRFPSTHQIEDWVGYRASPDVLEEINL